MHLLQHGSVKLWVAMIISLGFSLLATQTTLAARNQVSDMNDRFATEASEANGFARIRTTQVGGVVVDRVRAKNLLPDHAYQVVVAVQNDPNAPPPGLSGTADHVMYSGAVTTDKHGNFVLDDFDLGSLDGPGTYRVDVFVTHTHSTVAGKGAPGVNLTNVIDRDPLLACQPTFKVTVE